MIQGAGKTSETRHNLNLAVISASLPVICDLGMKGKVFLVSTGQPSIGGLNDWDWLRQSMCEWLRLWSLWSWWPSEPLLWLKTVTPTLCPSLLPNSHSGSWVHFSEQTQERMKRNRGRTDREWSRGLLTFIKIPLCWYLCVSYYTELIKSIKHTLVLTAWGSSQSAN